MKRWGKGFRETAVCGECRRGKVKVSHGSVELGGLWGGAHTNLPAQGKPRGPTDLTTLEECVLTQKATEIMRTKRIPRRWDP